MTWCWFYGDSERGDSGRYYESGGNFVGFLTMGKIQVFNIVVERGKKKGVFSRVNCMLKELEFIISFFLGNSRYVICGQIVEFMLEMEAGNFRGDGRKWCQKGMFELDYECF